MVVEHRSGNYRPVTLANTKTTARLALDDLWQATRDGTPFSLDSEFDPDDTLVTFSFSWKRGVRYVAEAETLPIFGDWFGDHKAKIVYSYFKTDCRIFDKMGLNLRPSFHADIVSLDWLRDENSKRHGLKQQVFRYLHRRRQEFGKLFSYVPPGKVRPLPLDASQIAGRKPLPEDALLVHSAEKWRLIFEEYGGDDAEDTILLLHKHRQALLEMGYWQSYLRIDRPYTLTLMKNEDRGILIDREGMDRMRARALVMQARAEHSFKAAIGYPDLNLEAKDQVKKILYEDLDWPAYDDLRTEKTGEPQLTKEVVRRWVNEGVDLAMTLERRAVYAKLAKDLKSLLSGCSDDGRLRSDYNQHGARSGRISSRKWKVRVVEQKVMVRSGKIKEIVRKKQVGANLQNVVSPGEKDPFGVKAQFVAPKKGQMTARGVLAEEDHVLIVVDMSGFELVLTIHRVGEFVPVEKSRLLKTMLKYGTPSACHVLTTVLAFGIDVDMDEICASSESLNAFKKQYKDGYRTAKECNFGLCYGGTWRTLARRRKQDTRSPEVQRENERLVDRFFNELYPELKIFQERLITRGYEDGVIETIGGRYIHVAEGLASIDRGEREHWERNCCNVPQADAADIIKVAMNAIEADEELTEAGFSQLAQVHDEVVGECPLSVAPECLERVQWHMEQPYKSKLRVKLGAEGKYASNWTLAKG